MPEHARPVGSPADAGAALAVMARATPVAVPPGVPAAAPVDGSFNAGVARMLTCWKES